MRNTLAWLLSTPLFACAVPAPALADAGHSPPRDTDMPMQKSAQGQVAAFRFGHPGKASQVTRTIAVTAMDYRFLPAAVDVRSGETVRFDIVNRGTVEHEFVIGDRAEQIAHDKEMAAMPGMKMDDDPNGVSIPPGGKATLIWTFTRPGMLQYACHVPGHYAEGMYGQLNVRS